MKETRNSDLTKTKVDNLIKKSWCGCEQQTQEKSYS